MKAINKFFDTASLWKVYIASWFITSLMCFIIFQCLQPLMTEEAHARFTPIVNLKIGAIAGLLFGLMLMLMISMGRKNRRFWDYAETVAKLANEASTMEQIKLVYNNELKTLHGMALGGPHYQEFRNIRTVLETKYKMFKKQDEVVPILSKEKFTDKFECKIGDKVIPESIKKAILAIDNTSTFDNGVIRTRLHYDTIQDIINMAD